MDFARLIHRAYVTTISHPVLWLLGLLLTSGFNLHFVVFRSRSDQWSGLAADFGHWASRHPHAGLICASLVAGYLVTGVVSSWVKSVFVLYSADLLEIPRLGRKDFDKPSLKLAVKQSFKVVAGVFAISFSMALIIIAGAMALFVPSLVWLRGNPNQWAVFIVAAFTFAVLVFFASFIGVFASFFAILHRQSVVSAINLATELVAAKWRTILVYSAVLMLIYGLIVWAGLGLQFFAGLSISAGLGNAMGIALILPLLVILFAMLNAFFNLALLLLFADLVKPRTIASVQPGELKSPVPAG